MKVMGFAGFLLALILGACPCLMPLAAAAHRQDAHSCCAHQGASKQRRQPARSGGDCCLRAPAQGQAAISAPELRFVFIALASAPTISAPRESPLPSASAAVHPPPDRLSSGVSPRAPPADA
jgi:hypothetical protein